MPEVRRDRISPHRQPLIGHGIITEHYLHVALYDVHRDPLHQQYMRRATLDGMYIECADDALWFRRVKGPIDSELTQLIQTLSLCISHFLERQGLLQCDAENNYLAGDERE